MRENAQEPVRALQDELLVQAARALPVLERVRQQELERQQRAQLLEAAVSLVLALEP